MTPEARMAELGIILPAVFPPAGMTALSILATMKAELGELSRSNGS